MQCGKFHLVQNSFAMLSQFSVVKLGKTTSDNDFHIAAHVLLKTLQTVDWPILNWKAKDCCDAPVARKKTH